MPKYAQFDPSVPAPQPVIGWYDTDAFDYPNLPAAANLLELTQEQWDARLITPFVKNGALVAAPVPTAAQALKAAKDAQIELINSKCQKALESIVLPYPPAETLTWANQYAEAQVFTSSSSAQTPMLSAIAAASGTTVSALAASVIAKATAYSSASGACVGKRQALTAQINAAQSEADVKAVIW